LFVSTVENNGKKEPSELKAFIKSHEGDSSAPIDEKLTPQGVLNMIREMTSEV
jgi:hypothetical protein